MLYLVFKRWLERTRKVLEKTSECMCKTFLMDMEGFKSVLPWNCYGVEVTPFLH